MEAYMQICTEGLPSDSRVKIENYIFRVHLNEEGNLDKVFRVGHYQGKEALGNTLWVQGKT